MAHDVTIRKAKPEDGAALMRAIDAIDRETEFLGVPGHPHPWAGRPEAELRALEYQGLGAVFLAIAGDGAVVGYLSAFAGHFLRNRGSIFIAVVGLREAWRGRGIGTRLFRAVEEWARARRAWRLELRVSSLNERGLALYRKSGFAIEGRIRGGVLRHGTWTDDFWMGKLLEPLPAPPLDPPNAAAPPRRRSGVAPQVRPMRAGDGAAFRLWDKRMSETQPFAIKLPSEVASAEAIEHDLDVAPSDPRLWLVATVPGAGGGDRVVGFGSGSIEYGFRMQHDAFINLAVLPEWTGRGAAGALHRQLEDWARGHGVRRLTALVQAPDRAGRGFAARFGYDDEVTMRGYSVIGGRMVDRIRCGKLLFA